MMKISAWRMIRRLFCRNDATAFLTNDRHLARLQPMIDVILLDDFLA